MTEKNILKSYLKFCEAEGNQHIASEYAIKKIVDLVKTFNISQILEIGLGIGSIAGTVLEIYNQSVLSYYGTENNDFCLKALERNLGIEYKNLKIHSSIKNLTGEKKFDLVIIDGTDENLEELEALISKNAIIAIEGDRKLQITTLKKIFPDSIFVHSISMKLNSDQSPFSSKHWQGGIKLIFVDPTSKQKVWCISEKIKTKVKYWIRALR